ncbi:MAG: DUF192 domain-containing protein [Paracoccaceae bacterium]
MVSLLLGAGPVSGASVCGPDRLDFRSKNSSVRFVTEVVDSPKTRALGLMNRKALGRFAGMLFVYDEPQLMRFWMRNTLISLDIIFIDAQGVVQYVHENAIPLDETTIFGGNAIQYVFEINGGLADLLEIGAGTQARHPAISGPEVIWLCD